jgi:hypothetical protein
MRELRTIQRGIRLTPSQAIRLQHLAGLGGISPNRMIGLLIDNATIDGKKKDVTADAWQGASGNVLSN